MLKFLNLEPEVFGADINDLSIKIVKLLRKRKGFDLVSFNEVAIAPGIVKGGVIYDQEALAKVITSACKTVKGKKLETSYVVVSLPEEKSFSQVIQMPKMTDEELRLAVPFEAENYIPLPIDKVYLDFQKISAEKEGLHDHIDLLINVMPKAIVDSYVECFKKAGLIPCVLEVESQAVARALVKDTSSSVPLLLIDLGVSNTSFVIFSSGSIRFTSSISISSQQLTEVIADAFSITPEKAEALKLQYGLTQSEGKEQNIKEAIAPIMADLVSQIKKYLNFYQGHVSHEYLASEGKIERVVLCGGGANLKGLPEFLSAELKISVEVGNPFVRLLDNNKNLNKIPNEKALSFTTAVGLALRGAQNRL